MEQRQDDAVCCVLGHGFNGCLDDFLFAQGLRISTDDAGHLPASIFQTVLQRLFNAACFIVFLQKSKKLHLPRERKMQKHANTAFTAPQTQSIILLLPKNRIFSQTRQVS